MSILCLLKDKKNIIDIIGFTLNPHSIVLEFAEMGDLNQYLQSETSKNITFEDKCKIGEDIASSIQVLHSFEPKIVHRDIKSLNVLVTKLDPLTVKLSDFETACFLPSHAIGKGVIDNPIWMAPELVTGIRFFFFLFTFSFYFFFIYFFFFF